MLAAPEYAAVARSEFTAGQWVRAIAVLVSANGYATPRYRCSQSLLAALLNRCPPE